MVPEKCNNNFMWAIVLSVFIHIVLWLMKNGDVDWMGPDQIEQAVIRIVKRISGSSHSISLHFGWGHFSLCSKYLGKIKHILPM